MSQFKASSENLSYENSVFLPDNKIQLTKHQEVSAYYSETLQNSGDLATNANSSSISCSLINMPQEIRHLISNIHPKVSEKYYGCGLLTPTVLDNLKVLDLGCGAGRDCFMEHGLIVGVDMIADQINIAKEYSDWHRNKFGYNIANTHFFCGNVENLEEIEYFKDKNDYFDLIVSNCVINLCPNKQSVFQSLYRLLKPGGEFYFSDMYSKQRIPLDLKSNKVLWSEGLSGSLYWNDFLRLSKESGFLDPRLVEDRNIIITDKEVEKKIGNNKYYAAIYRLFKIKQLDYDNENYGQAVIYKGTINNMPSLFKFDADNIFIRDKLTNIDGNTFRMLNETRFNIHFEFIGDFNHHYGLFEISNKFKISTS